MNLPFFLPPCFFIFATGRLKAAVPESYMTFLLSMAVAEVSLKFGTSSALLLAMGGKRVAVFELDSQSDS
jgi:hypothetical protein